MQVHSRDNSCRRHGLAVDEPLNVESIIRSCYNNPDRKKYPEYSKTGYSGWDGPVSIYSGEKDSYEYFSKILNNLILNSKQKFDGAGIQLNSTDHLWAFESDDHCNSVVDKEAYL